MRWPVVTLLVFLALAQAVLAEEDYFPLARGNRWVLRANNHPDRLVFSVDEVEGDVYEVYWENPWADLTFFLRPLGSRLYLEAMDAGAGPVPLFESTLFFDFSASADTVWHTALGAFRVLDDRATIQTSAGTFSNCRVVRQVTEQMEEYRWSFAPGVGLVRLSQGDVSFELRSYRLR